MRERTEEDIISKAPTKVTLGAVSYDIKPLPILKARAWRAQLAETMQTIVGSRKSKFVE